MRHRKLRIAWSAAWGVLAVLLCVLWVRSYWVLDLIGRVDPTITVNSNQGTITAIAIWLKTTSPGQNTNGEWFYSAGKATDYHHRFHLSYDNLHFDLQIPTWIPVIMLAALATIPWIRWRWRFGLRTLLIATTVIAVGLGAIIWITR